MEEITKHYLISGRVQGVGFRAYTQRMASELNLRGWVRNLPDGRVEAVVQGAPGALSKMEFRLREGPPGSEVESLTVSPFINSEVFKNFAVRKD